MTKVDVKSFILHQLADGHFHSGEALGKALGMSRAAVANHVKSLLNWGWTFFRCRAKAINWPIP